jgi:hypothetical protein
MAMKPETTNWPAVAAALNERIDELAVTKAELIRKSGVSFKTLDGYLNGEPIQRRDKRRDLCIALGWTTDSIDRILQGLEPSLAAPESDVLGDRIDSVEQAVREIRAEMSLLISQFEEMRQAVQLGMKG